MPRSQSPSAFLPFDIWRNVWRWSEMMTASAITIGIRSTGIAAGLVDPRRTDARENARMVTEKMQAASQSAVAASEAVVEMQRQVADAWMRHWGAITKASTTPGVAAPTLWTLPMALAVAGVAATESMMGPYHSRSTANAKRLGRKFMAQAQPRPSGGGRRHAGRG
ncbi:hypothetical protein [Arenibaculum sp.]|uniref:hypothetical protein n=1 Tax=Arenibaculum sp. TaxID=2865862 RepID=UPI002E10CD98|nr:hypothetical protein [Arenibaculum sp.]